MSSLAWIRHYYKVPAWRGTRVRFSGIPDHPITGRITSASDDKLWIRRDDNGKRFGPLHPAWQMAYDEGGGVFRWPNGEVAVLHWCSEACERSGHALQRARRV